MSINIPAETPDESDHPISVEEFEHLHPAMLEAIGKAVREELELSHATAERQLMFSARLIFNWSFLMYRWYSAMPCTASASETMAC